MNLSETEVNNYLKPFFGRYEDSFQETWVSILERNPQTLEEITPIIGRVKKKAIKQYLNNKFREKSLYQPIGKKGDEEFTLESILASPENEESEDSGNGDNGLYKKIVDFLIAECIKQENENSKLKRRDIELKAERLRLRRECLTFKKDRFESWKKLMEEKGKQKEDRFKIEVQLQREKLQFEKEQAYLKEKKRKK
ncbi:MAG: hypothetical protein ACE144_14665 [Thermodesulfobacteriota bacterium]